MVRVVACPGLASPVLKLGGGGVGRSSIYSDYRRCRGGGGGGWPDSVAARAAVTSAMGG
jgi:hypothetical protein